MFNFRNFPTQLIVLGATGDLMHKKIVPAIFSLYQGGYLPPMFHVVGYARRPLTDEDFQKSVIEILVKHYGTALKNEEVQKFVSHWTYTQGLFEDLKTFEELGKKLGLYDKNWKTCANKLFYIAAPPDKYEGILKNLHESGLTIPCSPEEGFTRVLIEKPFGHDSETANKLEMLLSSLFKEEQIYRIDHYLAKEMLQNILNFRFTNSIFEPAWNNLHIKQVEIRLWEKLGVEERGTFYDGLGALRDVGQNHLLQMLGLITMGNPGSLDPDEVRSKRADILKKLIQPSASEIEQFTYRSQYKGYQSIRGVDPQSKTETYFKIRAFLKSPRWSGVPFILESGKRMGQSQKEIVISFKHPKECLCPLHSKHAIHNKIIFQFEPEETVIINLTSKEPGLTYDIKGSQFSFPFREGIKHAQYTKEYEKLLLDAMSGNQMLFVRSDEVKAMWDFIDPIICAWDDTKVPLHTYTPDTLEPANESTYINNAANKVTDMKKEVGIIGLGKIGSNLTRHLLEKEWRVVGYNRTLEDTLLLEQEGIVVADSTAKLVEKLKTPRIVLLVLPAPVIDEFLFGKEPFVNLLSEGDTIMDFGNSYFKDSITRSGKLKEKGINFIDVGISGGPQGARHGASLMIGGDRKQFIKYEPLFTELSIEEGYQFFEGAGAGHFVKMVHNGIEYGMMQAIAEGFTLLKNSSYKLDMTGVADVYNHGSVIESRLMRWLESAFTIYGQDLQNVTGSVGHTGEAEWTVRTAKEMEIKTKVIEDALEFRKQSEKNPSYTGKILSAIRNQFGGHSTK